MIDGIFALEAKKQPIPKITYCKPMYAKGYVPESRMCLPEYQLVSDAYFQRNQINKGK